jgi:hypothetical protein
MPAPTRVALEGGRTWTFACAVDWPGWCRRGKTAEAAITELRAYAPRYAPVAAPTRISTAFEVIGEVPGDATTDFGAPSVSGKWDREPLPAAEADRLTTLLEGAWVLFDRVVAAAPAELRKGPRGGGRDRDAIVSHVLEAERAYGRRLGVRIPPRTPWTEQRAAYAAALRADAPDGTWPARYAFRRLAWHVLDHVWEIEDRSA